MRCGRVLLSILLLCTAIGFQSSGRAQGNLVNLYSWTFQTNLMPGVLVSQPTSVTILSAEAVLFIADKRLVGPLTIGMQFQVPLIVEHLVTCKGAI